MYIEPVYGCIKEAERDWREGAIYLKQLYLLPMDYICST